MHLFVAHRCQRLVPDTNRMVAAVKARADPQTLAQLAEPDAHIGMLKALAELGQCHDGHKLPRSHTDQLRHQYDDGVVNHAV